MASVENGKTYDIAEVMTNKDCIYLGKHYRISVLTERLIRFEYSKNGNFLDEPTHFAINRNFPKPNYEVKDTDKVLYIKTRYFILTYSKEKPYVASKIMPDANLKVKLLEVDKIWYPNHPEARNYKAGAFSLDDVSNIKLDKGLYSNDGFVCLDDTNGLIMKNDGVLEEKEDKTHSDFYLFVYKSDFGFCLNDYFTLTGFPALLPKYALGIWWNRDRIFSAEDTLTMVSLFKKYEIPLSVMLLGEFWHLKDSRNLNALKTGYTFNPSLFPNTEEYIKTLHKQSIKLGVNIDPVEGVGRHEPSYATFANTMDITDGKNIPFNILSKGFAQMFLELLISPLLHKNVDMFWVDYKDDRKKLEVLNYYLFSYYMKKTFKRGLILSRNHGTSSHRYPVLYSGETIVDWKTLDYLPSFNSNSSNGGLSWWSHDVGGFKGGIEDSELYLRYVQFSTFSPIFRFSAQRGAYYKREPWLWDIKTYAIVKNYCQLRHKLIPYIYSENYNYHKTGLPLVRPLYYDNPEIYDEPLYKNEYYFGSEFIIAPITKPKNIIMNRAVERIFLPEGIWYDYTTGKKFIGNKRYIVFFRDEDYPVFVKAGAIIPLSILGENLNDIENPKTLEFDIYPGKSNIYKLYEDDGETNLYKNGDYLITAIDYNYMANNYTVIIHPVEGRADIIPATRDYIIKFKNTKEAEDVNVFINSEKANYKIESYTDGVDFVVEVFEVDTTKQLTINCKGKDIEIDAVRIINEDINAIINDLKIETKLKEKIASIIFSDLEMKKKRIEINKLKKHGLNIKFATMFLKLLEYTADF